VVLALRSRSCGKECDTGSSQLSLTETLTAFSLLNARSTHGMPPHPTLRERRRERRRRKTRLSRVYNCRKQIHSISWASHQQISVVLLLFAASLTSVSFDMDDDTARAFRHEQCMNEGMSPDIDRPLLYFSWPPACDLWHPSKGCAVSRIERLLNFSSGEVEGLQGNLDPDTRQTLLFKSLRQEFAPRRHLKRVAGANYDDTMRFATK
jgi:hypothetical protein